MEKKTPLHKLIQGHIKRTWGLKDEVVDIQNLAKTLESAVRSCDSGHNSRVIRSPDGAALTAQELVEQFELEKYLQKN